MGGFRLEGAGSSRGEDDQGQRSGDQAVDGEREQRAGLGTSGSGSALPRRRRRTTRLPTSTWPRMPSPSGPEQVRELQYAGGEDDRRREQEREPGGVLVGQPRIRPATIVTPDRLIPGSRASDCALPMMMASRDGQPAIRRSASRSRPTAAGDPGGRARPGRRPAEASPSPAPARRHRAGSGAARSRRRSRSPASRMTPLTVEEHRGGHRTAQRGAEHVLQQQAGDADRDRREDEHPGQALVRGA